MSLDNKMRKKQAKRLESVLAETVFSALKPPPKLPVPLPLQ
jgi:hypothetical protein